MPVPGRTLLQYEMLDLLSETESSSQEFIIEEEQEHQPASWHQRLRHGVHTLWQGTKQHVNTMTDWVLEKVVRYVDHVTRDNEAYFPNIEEPTQRYWGQGSVNMTVLPTNTTCPALAHRPLP